MRKLLAIFTICGLGVVFAGECKGSAEKARLPIPDKLIVLTFDDGNKTDISYVAPLLKRYGFGATFFITEGLGVLKDNKTFLTWDEVRKLHEDGFEIGNHTRSHLNVTRLSKEQLRAELEYIEKRCKEHGIPRPTTFCYPGWSHNRQAVEVLAEKGFLFARRGCGPELPEEKEGGLLYDPAEDHPLLVPTAGSSGPNWKFEDLVRAVARAKEGKIAVLTFHGVPSSLHPWVSTKREDFARYMKYLHDQGCTVIAMRDLAKYVDPAKGPSNPYAPIQRRLDAKSRGEKTLGEDSSSEELRRKFSAWRDKVVQWRKDKLAEPNLPNEMTFDDIMPAPDDPALWPLWRNWLVEWRKNQRKALNYEDKYYRAKEFVWVPASVVSSKIMSWEMLFIDAETGEYTVDKFLKYGEKEYGGFDNVLLWQGFPRLGFDERSQFDYYRDLPGGLKGLREVAKACHAKGVKVFITYNPWDTGTRREAKSDVDLLMETVEAIDADGIYLDTWFGSDEVRTGLDDLRPGLAIQTELAVALEDVAAHHMSWGQSKPWKTWLFKDSHAPGVVRNKWFERRHVVYPTNRWIPDRTGNLQTSWMNGTGTLVWENRFGCWNGWSPRDRSILRSMVPIQRRYISLFSGEAWTPLVENRGDNVFASLWEGGGLRLWTLVNRDNQQYDGELLNVPHAKGTRYFDLIRGVEAKVNIKAGTAGLAGSIAARDIGAIIALPEKAITEDFTQFLRKQTDIFAQRDANTNYPEGEGFATQVEKTRSYNKKSLPRDMVAIDAGQVKLEFDFRTDGRPAGFHWETPKERKLELSAYAIDLAPVTNRQYAEFLKASDYKPRHNENFLKHWTNGKVPAGKEDHPVVYVDLSDARAYAKWAGKRLPTEEEWQYAAGGPKSLKYPWGNEMKPDVCNEGKTEGTTPVLAFPQGRSPFGCYDMCGNTWEWTESERSNEGRTRYCYVRGGSFYKAQGSGWYCDGGPQTCTRAAKFLLIWPGLDRCSTIGFRCVADMAKE